jgi:DNA-binding transcriptional LysR family regulator
MRTEISGLLAFLSVADNRSFRAASEQLGVTSSAVSQAVKQIEEHLGVQLLQRTTRSVGLTEVGAYLHRSLTPTFAQLRATLASVGELKGKPSGTLRLSVSSVAESFLSEGTLAQFLAEYPDIKLDVCIDDSTSDIVREGFDAGVRLGEVVDKDMVAVSVSAPQRQVVVAAPAYLERQGTPKHPRELHGHSCIGWRHYGSPAPYRWEFSKGGKDFEVTIDARVNTNDMGLMVRLARGGVGLTIGLEESFRPYLERGELVTVLDPFCPLFPGFFLYYPSRSRMSPKLKALSDFLRRRARPAKAR